MRRIPRSLPLPTRHGPAQVGNHLTRVGRVTGSNSGGHSAVTAPRSPASPVPPGTALRPPPYLGAAGTAAEPLPGPALRIAGRSRQMGRREGVKISSEIRAAFLADQSPARRGGSSAAQGDNASADRMAISPGGGGGPRASPCPSCCPHPALLRGCHVPKAPRV